MTTLPNVPSSPLPHARWLDERCLEIDGQSFIAAEFQIGDVGDRMVIMKPPLLISRYLDLIADERPRIILELGIKEGGSAAMMALAAEPDVLIAIDLESEAPALVDFVDRRGLRDRVTVRFGIDQGDRSTVAAIVDEARGDRPLDLVVDDASHVLEPTVRSFETLFPRVRPGGCYVIEDWSADLFLATILARHVDPAAPDFDERLVGIRNLVKLLNSGAPIPPEVVRQLSDAAAEEPQGDGREDGSTNSNRLLERIAAVASRTDLSALGDASRSLVDVAVMLLLASAQSEGAIAQLTVDEHWLLVRRGTSPLDENTFRLPELGHDYLGYLQPR